jgi:carbon storage regulator CsrA
MLVLSRKAGQTIVVADDISISVLGIRRGAVRLGIKAPREVQVCRKELLMPPDPGTAAAGGTPDGSPTGTASPPAPRPK